MLDKSFQLSFIINFILLLDDKQTCEGFDFTSHAESSEGEMEDSQHNRNSVCSIVGKFVCLRLSNNLSQRILEEWMKCCYI